ERDVRARRDDAAAFVLRFDAAFGLAARTPGAFHFFLARCGVDDAYQPSPCTLRSARSTKGITRRITQIADGNSGKGTQESARMSAPLFVRHPENPIVRPGVLPWRMAVTFNPAVIKEG